MSDAGSTSTTSSVVFTSFSMSFGRIHTYTYTHAFIHTYARTYIHQHIYLAGWNLISHILGKLRILIYPVSKMGILLIINATFIVLIMRSIVTYVSINKN